MLHETLESANVNVDDIKPRRERSQDNVENTNNEEREEFQEDEGTRDEEEGIDKEYT